MAGDGRLGSLQPTSCALIETYSTRRSRGRRRPDPFDGLAAGIDRRRVTTRPTDHARQGGNRTASSGGTFGGWPPSGYGRHVWTPSPNFRPGPRKARPTLRGTRSARRRRRRRSARGLVHRLDLKSIREPRELGVRDTAKQRGQFQNGVLSTSVLCPRASAQRLRLSTSDKARLGRAQRLRNAFALPFRER